jgi:hypothetical protein
MFCARFLFGQLRVSALLTNGAYVLNLDNDHCVTNSGAFREAMCFLMDPVAGNMTCFVQFPLRPTGVNDDGHDRSGSVFFDVRDDAQDNPTMHTTTHLLHLID